MRIKSTQIKGKGRGKSLGFPTINLKIPENLKLEDGIYASLVEVDGKKYKGALYFGPIPTFNEDEKSLEVYLIDVNYANYKIPQGRSILLKIIKRIRGIQKFDEPIEMVKQIRKDIEKIVAVLS